MILRLLLLGIIAVLIYRFFGGKLPFFSKTKEERKLDEDTLVECEKCSTYITLKESIIVQGKYYCSKECSL